MDTIQIAIYGITLVVIIFLATYVFELKWRDYDTGVYEIRGSRGKHGVEEFKADIDYVMGPYSNKRFEHAGKDTPAGDHHEWRQPPQHLPLQINSMYTPSGTPLPLNPEESKQPLYTNGPSVDGTKNTPPSMFMFSHNQCKPDCCPSTYSCNGGCVCTTPNQRDFINNRGTSK
uniref:Uncharacterized protein n=1 Tax=viral metagenome TaxID=1070528 RepID=A0A6C0JIJ2_9ZZZZ